MVKNPWKLWTNIRNQRNVNENNELFFTHQGDNDFQK